MVTSNTGTTATHKLRVLCLHGYVQDSSTLKTMLRNHIAALDDCVEFVFVTAPNIIRPYDIDGMDNMARIAAVRSGKAIVRDTRCWYHLKSAKPEIVFGLENSFDFLSAVLEKQGPFDGVFGFSQGGLMAALLSSLLEHKSPVLNSSHPALKFAIISSGFMLQDAKWIHLYESPISTPSLHIFGVLDGMITLNRSMELKNCFVRPEELCFVGAHFVPKTDEAVKRISDFVRQFA